MKRKELVGEDAKADSVPNHIFNNALGKVIILDAAATTANGLVPEGEAGFNPTTRILYFTIGGSTYSTAVLTLV